MRFTVIINILAMGILAFFFISVLVSGKFDSDPVDQHPAGGGRRATSFLPNGIGGIFPAMPFAIWFFLAIEELPLAAEESMDPEARHPSGHDLGHDDAAGHRHSRILFLNTGVGGGAREIGGLGDAAVRRVQGDLRGGHIGATCSASIGLTGLIASFFTIIYAYGRNTYSLSRAGYFPKWLSITHPRRGGRRTSR